MQSFQTQRIVTVDALRGFALLGIFLAHTIFWYSAGSLPDTLFSHMDMASGIISGINDFLISGKFFAFFSFLFGLSFFLQMQSMEKKQTHFVARYAWRIVILGVIGMIHHAFWRGDILSIYAPLGFLLLPMRKLNNRIILILGILFAINVPGKLINMIQFLTAKPGAANGGGVDWQAAGKLYYHLMSQGNWTEILKGNWHAWIDKYNFQVDSGRIFITFGFFLLGMYTGRKRWFENTDTAKPILIKICKNCAWLMLGSLVIAMGMFGLDALLKLGWQQNPIAGFIFSIFYDLFNAALVCIYISGLTLLMYKPRWQKRLFPFSTVGKMALTCYLMQTAVGLLLFYHVGFGLVGKTTQWQNWLITFVFFIIQSLFCRFWLQKFNYGPIEWLWRSLTWFKWQPMWKNK
jgi:uncharacterized protein